MTVARRIAQVGGYSVTLAESGADPVTLLGPDANEIVRGCYILPMIAAAERLSALDHVERDLPAFARKVLGESL